MRFASLLPDPLKAVLLRELRAALVNRYIQIFSLLASGAGIAAAVLSENADAALVFILQVSIYLVSLFALLAGVGSARAETEEWPLLFAQPIPRPMCIAGKFVATFALSAGVLVLLFAPALLIGGSAGALAHLYGNTLALAAIFGSMGILAGICAHDRVQALVAGVGAWLLMLLGFDLAALFTAHWPLLQKTPDIWVALLMLNPLDAFRIQALFALEQIPPEAANKTALAHWWLGNASAWFVCVSTAWTAALVSLASLRLARTEL